MDESALETWEYKVELILHTGAEQTMRHVLNTRGAQGWELVSVAPRIKPVLGRMQGGDLLAVFKRRGLGTFDPDIADPPAH